MTIRQARQPSELLKWAESGYELTLADHVNQFDAG